MIFPYKISHFGNSYIALEFNISTRHRKVEEQQYNFCITWLKAVCLRCPATVAMFCAVPANPFEFMEAAACEYKAIAMRQENAVAVQNRGGFLNKNHANDLGKVSASTRMDSERQRAAAGSQATG
ncbi:hypothetical protein Nepgr_013815 [Nepenthes gracilis]|uniref:Uncharacterized protein n=1 Tax=Nepenthes gracilis TaxID=150966 RepID=A0AAD3SJQ5_NEPGR|nr:hypothetical protein Nepgr_013815 [Nepenthes gracilis]